MVACSACGAHLAQGVSFCSGCGRPITAFAMPVQPKKTSALAWLTLIFIVVCLFAWIVNALSGGSASRIAVSAAPPDDCSSNAFAYLLALKEGNGISSGYWKPGAKPMTLYSVRSFDEIAGGSFVKADRQPFNPPRRYEKFTVESSTHGGIPITKRWNVIMEPSSTNFGGRPCAIVALKEAE
jgi:hypothetical protein